MSTARASVPSEELDFQSSVEALFVQALRADLTPSLKARLKEEGLDVDKLQPAYPRRVFSRCCRIAAEALYPDLIREEALRLLGRRLIEGYSLTLIGRAVMGVFKLIGVRRGLERLTRAFRNGDNYTETRFILLEPGRADVTFNQVNGQPTFTQGMLEACLDWVGARDSRVMVMREEGDGAVFRLTWTES